MTENEKLLSLPENRVLTLSPREAYLRSRLISAKEQAEFRQSSCYNPATKGTYENGSKRKYGPYKVFTDWRGD